MQLSYWRAVEWRSMEGRTRRCMTIPSFRESRRVKEGCETRIQNKTTGLVKLAFLVAGCHCRHDNTISRSLAMGAAAPKYGRHHQSILPPHSSSGCISRLALNLSRVHLYINSSASCLASPIFLLIQVCCFGRLFFGYRRVLCFRSCILFPPWIFASPRSVCRPSGTP